MDEMKEGEVMWFVFDGRYMLEPEAASVRFTTRVEKDAREYAAEEGDSVVVKMIADKDGLLSSESEVFFGNEEES